MFPPGKVERRMFKRIFSDKGGHLREYRDAESPKPVPFPVCLAIKYGDTVTDLCSDFILDIDESWVFVRTGSAIPEGTPLLLHFYIPPENKLLAEIKGRIVTIYRNDAGHPTGLFVKLAFFSRRELRSLDGYLEEKKHLVDRET